MMMAKFNPMDSGYIEVKDRIAEFYAKYPNGAIRTNVYSMDESLVVVGAEVFQDKDDTLPIGTGFSSMEIPGSTSFTRGSEIENAETSAVGRAIAMAGFSVHKSVASADEVAAKVPADPADEALRASIRKAAEQIYGAEWKKKLKSEHGLTVSSLDTKEDLLRVEKELKDVEIPF
jgi:hypothetical protein